MTMSFKIGDIVTFTSNYRPRELKVGVIDKKVDVFSGLIFYQIVNKNLTTELHTRNELKHATNEQIVNELSEWLRDDLVANYKETV